MRKNVRWNGEERHPTASKGAPPSSSGRRAVEAGCGVGAAALTLALGACQPGVQSFDEDGTPSALDGSVQAAAEGGTQWPSEGPADGMETGTEKLYALGLTYPDNSCAFYQTKIGNGFQRAAEHLSLGGMVDCVKEAPLGYYPRAPYPEMIVDELKQALPTRVFCDAIDDDDGYVFWAVANGPGNTAANETMTFNTNALGQLTVEQIAETIIHEVAHNKGYSHPELPNEDEDSGSYGSFYEYQISVPEQVGNCINQANENRPEPAWYRLDDEAEFAQGSVTNPVGLDGGNPMLARCPNLQYATGLRVALSGAGGLDGVWVTCNEAGHVGRIGRSSASWKRLRCDNSGRVVVGIHGRANSLVQEIGVLCDDFVARANGNSSLFLGTNGKAGKPQGPNFQRECPPGQIMTGLRGRGASRVDQLQLECAPINKGAKYDDFELPFMGGTGGDPYYARCPQSSGVVGLRVQADHLVRRLGGVCQQVRPNGTLSPRSFLDSHGGTTGILAKESCPQGYLLIGAFVGAGKYIDSVQGLCGHVGDWKGSAPAPRWQALEKFGGDGGTLEVSLCPRGQFFAGWNMRHGTIVDGFAPICDTL